LCEINNPNYAKRYHKKIAKKRGSENPISKNKLRETDTKTQGFKDRKKHFKVLD